MADDNLNLHGDLLGKQTDYVSDYTPALLCSIDRQLSRLQLGIKAGQLPFKGADLWTAYEVSWLDSKGKPHIAVADFRIAADSPFIIESKSFKLYLNSFNQTQFDSLQDVVRALETDLSKAAGGAVMVALHSLRSKTQRGVGHFSGECIDGEEVQISAYHPDASLLLLSKPDRVVSESLYSDLLKTNCPVTGQPDWASVLITYRGSQICRSSLLKYIISFREHQDFHEHCVERMFLDIKEQCGTQKLAVYARYTRRGGLDINPYRTDSGGEPEEVRLVRQ